MQGCNLSCIYCHNPETQKECCLCGICVESCPARALLITDNKIIYLKDLCQFCDKCLQVCPYFSSPKYYRMSADELSTYILKYSDFLDGITFSGGECTLQTPFIIEVSQQVKNNSPLTIFLDTNGQVSQPDWELLSNYVEGVMVDLKAFNSKTHQYITGIDNSLILDNIIYASQQGFLYEVRIVILKGINNREEEVANISNFIKNLNDYTYFKLLPFRPYGVKSPIKKISSLDNQEVEKLFKIAQNILGERVRIPLTK
ncbi:MAG: putative glycyl-radical enzyme activating enzyme YjjW [candidate division WS2 bacterium]|nr:putative glycyl-radical enzyme activating enzyme YjjW [Candidatus Lithacetigena glycinireducens]